MNKHKISFVGLGKLGLPLATNFAKVGNKVIAIDKSKDLIKTLKKGKAPWMESGLEKNIKLAEDTIEYTLDYAKAVGTDISVILVNTPSVKKDGSFSNLYVEQTLKSLCDEFVKAGKRTHHFILSSTVMPRSIKDTFIPLIESITGWSLEKGDFGFSYVPDFVAIGQIIKDFEHPDFLLIGSSDSKYANQAENLYLGMIKNFPSVSKLNLAEAELCKVSLNAYITTKISFANYLGMLAEKIDSDINIDNVTDTIGMDKRIGGKYFKAGNSYGGTCFPRDTWAFAKISEKVGMKAEQMFANESINDQVDNRVLQTIIEADPKKVALVGLGFKPGTSVVTEGLALKLTNRLLKYNIEVLLHDKNYEAFENITKVYDSNYYRKDGLSYITWYTYLDQVVEDADVVVFCINDKDYQVQDISSDKKVIDPWRIN